MILWWEIRVRDIKMNQFNLIQIQINTYENIYRDVYICRQAFQVAWVIKDPPVNTRDIRDVGLIPGLERSPEGGYGNPLQYFCLENPMDRGAWQVRGLQRVRYYWSNSAHIFIRRLIYTRVSFSVSWEGLQAMTLQ